MVFESRQVWTSSQLPTLSILGMRVLELSCRPETGARQLTELLCGDTGMALRVVNVANSPLFASPVRVETVEQAVAVLGTAAVTALVLTLEVGDACLNRGSLGGATAAFWRQAVAKAIAAEILCGQVREGLECEYFLAGLLLDAGRFALLRTAPQSFLPLLERAGHELLPTSRTEQAALGLTSAQVGAQLIAQWGFPPRLVRGIQVQSAPLVTLQQEVPADECPLCSALALASAMGDFLCGEQQALAWFRIHELTRDILPLSEAELSDILRRIATRFQAVAPVLLATGELPDPDGLKLKAIHQMKLLEKSLLNAAATSTPGSSTQREPGLRESPTDPDPTGVRNYRDPLTLVFTRELFVETLHKEVQRCRQKAVPLGVAFVEIDRLPQLRAKHGQSFGDVILKRVGGLLKDLLRSADTIARFDQQFAILASEPTAKGMQRLADRIRGRIAGERLAWNGQEVPLTVCVGATLALPTRRDQNLGPTIITQARGAVREAAVGEGNNVYFNPLVDEVELKRLFMANHYRFSRWLIAQGVLDIPRVGKALVDYQQPEIRLGDLAVRQELLATPQIEQILAEQEECQDRFGEIAVRRGLLTEDQLAGLLIMQHEDPILVSEQFVRKSIFDQDRLRILLKEYFKEVPWAAPLHPSTGRA